MFEKLTELFGAIRNEAESEAASKLATFDELAQRLAEIEISGDGTPPDASEVRATLDAAGRTADDLQTAVSRLLEIDKLEGDVGQISALENELRENRQEQRTEAGRFEAQRKKHETKLAELVDRDWRIRGELDRLSQSKARLGRLRGENAPPPPMTLSSADLPLPTLAASRVIAPTTPAAQAARDLVRWQAANNVPASAPPDPATIPAQTRLREVEAKIASAEEEHRKRGGGEFVRLPNRLLEEQQKVRGEIAKAENRWKTWNEYQRRQRAIKELAGTDV